MILLQLSFAGKGMTELRNYPNSRNFGWAGILPKVAGVGSTPVVSSPNAHGKNPVPHSVNSVIPLIPSRPLLQTEACA
jgi:hypothetical protein